MGDFGSVIMLILDVAVISALGLALWRFGRDPSALWEERETRLKEVVRGLRTLVGEAEEQARMIDAQLAGRLEELRGLLETEQATSTEPPTPMAPRAEGKTGPLRRQIRELAARATPLEEIARRVDMPVAEVRLLVGLQGGRGGKNVAAKSAA